MYTTRCIVQGLFLGACASIAHSQPQIWIGPQVRVDNGNDGSGVEPTVAFVRDATTMQAMAAAIDWRDQVAPRIGYGITFDGGLSWEEGIALSAVDPWDLEYGVDPHAWADPVTGDIWLLATGGQSGQTFNRLLALKRAQGVHSAQLPGFDLLTDGNSQEHRPVMAAGPAPGNANDRFMYLLFSRFVDPNPHQGGLCTLGAHLMVMRSEDNGFTWTTPFRVEPFPYSSIVPPPLPTQCYYQGNAGGLIVADREPHLGMLIAMPCTFEHIALWSTDGGQTWPAWGDRLPFLPTSLLLQHEPPNDWPGPFRVPFNTAAALDPASGEFYLVTCARREVGSRNIDLYISRGRTTTGTPPIAFDPAVRLELDPTPGAEGPDQLMPSIAVDGLGAINLLYYDTRDHIVPDDHPSAFLDVYYTRITDFGTPQQSQFTARLTTATFSSDLVYEDPFLEQFVGDYNTVDAYGCEVYVAYMSAETGQRHYYVRRIDLCRPDADDNLMVNATDASTFQSLFAAGDPRADVNRDGVVDVSDFAAFTAAFAAWSP